MSQNHKINGVKVSHQIYIPLNNSVQLDHIPCSKSLNSNSEMEINHKGKQKTRPLNERTETLSYR